MARAPVFDLQGLATAGLSVVARDGWPAASVRAVADELGVSAMALYRLVPDAESLRRLIADAAARPIQPRTDGNSLAAGLRAWAVDAYEHLGRYPGLATYVLQHWTELPRWLDIVEALLARADTDGLSGPAGVATVNAVFAYVLARAQLHDAAAGAPARQLAPLRGDPGRYPLLKRNLDEFTTARTERHFAFGLDALLAGLGSGR
jgi:AcrR family transcriptional regulator